MKKVITSVVSILICAILIFVTVIVSNSVGYSDLPSPENAVNLVSEIKSAVNSKGKANTEKLFDSNIKTCWTSSEKADYIEIAFDEPQTFNTVLLREKGHNIKKFSLYYYVDIPAYEHWEKFYEQDTVQDYRFCAFEEITADKIKLEVSESDNVFKLREFEIYNLESKNIDNFRVSDYVLMPDLVNGSFYDENSDRYFHPEYCNVINQVHVIAAAKWNNKGELEITEGASEEQLSQIVKDLRSYYGNNKVEIFATVFFNNCNPDIVFSEHKDDVIKNTIDFLLRHGFDGISYDWEYPTKSQWPAFNEHLVSLKKELNKYSMKLSCAFSGWNCEGMSKEAIDSLDQIEIMSYDNFDNDGNHSSFTSGAVQPIEYFLELGFKPEQLNIGIPFYARPVDGSGVWVDYDDPNYTPADKFQNLSKGMWFNSTQMVMDKTAYAIEKGIGGIMIFTSTEDISYDHEQSLLKSVENTISQRITAE